MSKHPAYKNSTIVQNAATASRLIVTGSGYLANALQSGASAFQQKTKPNPKPMTFTPQTQERIRKLNNLTHGAVGISAATVGQVGKVAQSFGARLGGHKEAKQGKKGAPAPGYKPGVLNKSMIAFSTIADGIEQSAKNLLNSGSTATSTVVSHRYGAEAGQVAAHLAGGVRNVGLVYIDATGVSRKAVIKSVGKGMIVGKTAGGGHVIVGEGDGGVVPPELIPKQGQPAGQPQPGIGAGATVPPGTGQVGFGNQVPAGYGSGVGEPLGGLAPQGQQGYAPGKR
jgi:spartin